MKKNFNKIFETTVIENTEIYNRNKTEKIIITNKEIFKQCYADTPTRKLFPKYWFVSNLGNLISVYSGKPVLVTQNQRKSGSKFYIFKIKDNLGMVRYKNIEVHNLAALVHGSEVFGLAEPLLEREGLNAFGIKGKNEPKINGHHKNSKHDDNNVDNIQLVSTDVHILLEKAPKPSAAEETLMNYMQEINNLMKKEAPNKMVILFPGYSTDNTTGETTKNTDTSIHIADQITFTGKAVNQLQALLSFMQNTTTGGDVEMNELE